MHAVHIRAIHAMSSNHSMHLPEKIPLGGRLYIHEGLRLGSLWCNDGCFKSWIWENWVDLCELHMPFSCMQLCFAQLAPTRQDRSEIVCTLDIFGMIFEI